MKFKKFCHFLLIVLMLGCTSSRKEDTKIKGFVKGLQKGTLYLEKIQDTAYVIVDSVFIKGEEEFKLACELKEPEMLFLRFSSATGVERIPFFAYNGTTTINTNLKQFSFGVKIQGGPQQTLLEDYYANIKRFKDRDLELLEVSLNAERLNDVNELKRSEELRNINIRRQYLYSINFAVKNSGSEVAAYIALTDLHDCKKIYLDTIYNSLSSAVAASKYGVILKEYIQKMEVDN